MFARSSHSPEPPLAVRTSVALRTSCLVGAVVAFALLLTRSPFAFSLPDGYDFCSNENDTCSFSAGPKDVAYGVGTSFTFHYAVASSTGCDNATFGDPSPGNAKACYTRAAAPTSGSAPYWFDFAWCSNETTHCSFSGVKVVAYGNASGVTVFHNITGGIDCDNTTFGGDPAEGSFKACFTRDDEPNGDYSFCAAENNLCSFDGEMDVAFGADGLYYYQYSLTGGISCDVADFGDPNVGTPKACYVKPSSEQSTMRGKFNMATAIGLKVPSRLASHSVHVRPH